MNPASGIRLVERSQYALPHSEAEGGRRPLQGGRLAKHDAIIEDAWISAEGQGPKQAQDDDRSRSGYRFENRDWHAISPQRGAISTKSNCLSQALGTGLSLSPCAQWQAILSGQPSTWKPRACVARAKTVASGVLYQGFLKRSVACGGTPCRNDKPDCIRTWTCKHVVLVLACRRFAHSSHAPCSR